MMPSAIQKAEQRSSCGSLVEHSVVIVRDQRDGGKTGLISVNSELDVLLQMRASFLSLILGLLSERVFSICLLNSGIRIITVQPSLDDATCPVTELVMPTWTFASEKESTND